MEDTHEITVTYKVTTEDLKDILCTAFEGGSDYWVDEVKLSGNWVRNGPNNYVSDKGLKAEHLHEIPAIGGTVFVREYESCRFCPLTRERLLRGIARAAQEGRINPAQESWTSDVDVIEADVILQYALLNEIRYG